MPNVLIETLRGAGTSAGPDTATGDQNLATFISTTVSIDLGFIDIGQNMTPLAAYPLSIDHVVLRVHADVPDDPGLQPLVFQMSWHLGLLSDQVSFQSPPADNWFTVSLTEIPGGGPWTRALLQDLDISFNITWDQQNPFVPGTLTLRIQEHEAQVWGHPGSRGRIVIENNIRLLTNDVDPSAYAISDSNLHGMVSAGMQHMAARTFLPQEEVLTLTMVPGTYDYTLTGISGDIRRIIRNSDGVELGQMTMEQLNARYRQGSSNPAEADAPTDFAPFETSAQVSRIRVGPTPVVSDSLDVYYGVIPSALTDDASLIPFSEPLLRALERAVAARCVSAMSETDRKRRMISDAAIAQWLTMSDQAVREENLRMRIMGSGTQTSVMEKD
jgi:hypothetical protein